MTQSNPLASVVVASLDGCDILRRCLLSLSGQDYEPCEVIVVDNGSQEDVAGLVSREFPTARCIRLERNLGFAGGYNRGIEAASGKYAAVINDDAVAAPRWIAAMVEAAEADESTGAVASVIIDGNNPAVLDSCGVGVALDGMSRQAIRGAPVGSCGASREALVASGCACMYRKAALDEVGLFDEDFFAYCEDTDLGLRLLRAGWKTAVVTGAEVTHYYSMTTGKSSLRKLFWVERNHFWVALKNFPLLLLCLVPLVTAFRFFLQAYLMLAGKGGLREFAREGGIASVVKTVFRAHLSAIAGARRMTGKRMAMKTQRKIGGLEMTRLILRHRMSIYEVLAGRRDARN